VPHDTKYLLANEDGEIEWLEQKDLYDRFEESLLVISKEQRRLGVGEDGLPKRKNPAMSELGDLNVHSYLNRIKAPRIFKEYIAAFYGSEYGVGLKEVNSLHLFDDIWVDSSEKEFGFFEDVWDEGLKIEGGNQQIPLAIAEKLHNVHLSHVLKSIQSQDQKWFVLTFETPKGLKIISASHLIVTIPFNVLRDAVDLDVNGFPADILGGIRNKIYGRNSKMVLYFNYPVWKKDYAHSGSVQTARFLTWDSSFGQGSKWGSLTIFFYKDENLANSKQISKAVLSTLEGVYGGISASFVSLKVANWPEDPYSKGSYSGAIAPGHWPEDASQSLRRQVGHLIFAGEHLSIKSPGYMNGAVETGIAAAKMTCSLIRRESPCF